MDIHHDTETIDDLSALAWVHEELRRSLEGAHKAMRRYLRESEALAGSDVDAVDPSVLRSARTLLHQGVGALELVGLPTAAQVLRGSETALTRLSGRPVKLDAAAVEVIERASFALLDYLSRLLAAKPVSPLAMFPQYRAVQELAGADRIHPADLWPNDWQWRDVAGQDDVAPRAANAELRGEVEARTLALMRTGASDAAADLSGLFASLAAGSVGGDRHLATLWRMAAAFFEAQAQGLLQPDVYSKRIASRLLGQLRMSEQGHATGSSEVSQRLAQDLLFFCAQAASPGAGRRAPRLAAVRLAWNLARRAPVDYMATRLGRFDPVVITQAKKRVSAGKEGWAAVAGGELHRLSSLNEQFHLIGESLRKLYPQGDQLGAALAEAVAATVQAGSAPAPALAMEVATAILYLEASLEDADFDHPTQAERVLRLAERVQRVRRGAAPQPLDAWMEELYRHVSDRHTMGSVVQELKTALGEAEKAIDLFFRQPAKRELLHPVPVQLNAMRGVFSVLGLEQASHAVVRMRDDVDALAAGSGDMAEAAPTDRLASNLGALGFLIDMLNVQPAMAKSLFAYDANKGLLLAVAAGGSHRASGFGALDGATAQAGPVEPRLIEQAQSLALAAGQPDVPLAELRSELNRLTQEALIADQPELAETMQQVQNALEVARNDDERSAVREELAQSMADFVNTSSQSVPLDMQPARPIPMRPATPTPAGQTGLEEDAEMRGVFLEEAREVIGNAHSALSALAHASDDLGEMTTVRRAFHTLKGSSRMVGLKDFGEAAWACEQTFNARLAEQQPADHTLLALTNDVLAYLTDWVESIAAHRDGGHVAGDVQAAWAAFSRREGDVRLALPRSAPLRRRAAEAPAQVAPLHEPAAHELALPVISSPVPLLDLVPELPPAGNLELVPAKSGVQPLEALLTSDEGVEFELDLGDAARMPVGEGEALQALPTPEPVPGAPTPDAVSSMMSLDLSEPVEAPAAPALTKAAEGVRGPMQLAPEPPPPIAPEPASLRQPVPAREPEPVLEPEPEPYKMIGPLRVSIPLFNIYLNEADEQSRLLATELAEWAHDAGQPVGDAPIALAHSLAGNSATVGFSDLSQLARLLEHALMRSQGLGAGHPLETALFNDSAEEIRRLLHQFAAGLLKSPSPALMQRLVDHERWAAERVLEATARAEAEEAAARAEAERAAARAEAERAAARAEAEQAAARAEAEQAAARAEAEQAAARAEAEQAAARAEAEQAAARAEAEQAAARAEAEQAAARAEAEQAAARARAAQVAQVPVLDSHAAPAEALRAAEPTTARAEAADSVPAVLSALGQTEFQQLSQVVPLETAARGVPRGEARGWADEDIDAVDAVDAELFPIFQEEAAELLPRLHAQMRDWASRPSDSAGAAACMRTLHTLKGGARLAGAMRLGEMSHRLESAVDRLAAREGVAAREIEDLFQGVDALDSAFEALQRPATPIGATVSPPALPLTPRAAPITELPRAIEVARAEPPPAQVPPPPPPAARQEPPAVAAMAESPSIDWRRFAPPTEAVSPVSSAERAASAAGSTVRVRAPLLDRLVNHAGEVSITRSRIESAVAQFKASLADLTENLERLRSQLREIELQAETQIASRMEQSKAAGVNFDPLEMDRFTRFQELTRMMAESVNDVATVQRSLQRAQQSAEDDLAAQARLTRDLQDDLLRTRMVEFESLSDRLYRVVRQTAKELDKQVRLDIVGGSIEVDRGVLERMSGAFEHLLRNSVSHGIESPDARRSIGKDPTGQITVSLAHEGNEVAVEFRDDGAGLNLGRIRERGVALGLLTPDAQSSDAELANLIFTPGFSTAETVTELSGRGVGMDVVRNEINALGGRIETASAPGQGTSFRLVLPLTTAVTQVVMLSAGAVTVAVPATLVETVQRVPSSQVAAAQERGAFEFAGRPVPFFWLGALLQAGGRSTEPVGRTQSVVIIKSAQQRVAVHVDNVVGNQEVVVKNLGAQLARLPGLAGVTLLASGMPALIYNPVALATLYGEQARRAMQVESPAHLVPAAETPVVRAPLVLVVDDSLTVRRVTQRLLAREGYRVALAKDGLEALERLAEELPVVVLSDIEMPRMDGFDLVRNLRADARLTTLPVIMITSRIAQKHREHAAELGVDHYLGKPYSEEDLLSLVARYAASVTA